MFFLEGDYFCLILLCNVIVIFPRPKTKRGLKQFFLVIFVVLENSSIMRDNSNVSHETLELFSNVHFFPNFHSKFARLILV